MKTRSIASAAFIAVYLLFNQAIANAVPIQFIMTGIGSGTIGGTAFPNSNFTITSLGDTNSRVTIPSPPSFTIDNISSSITIEGIGTFQVLSGTRTYVNNTQQLPGYSRAGTFGADLYDGPTNAAFATWDMLSSIGPIGGTASLLQWSGSDPHFTPVNTNAGIIIFNDAASPVTFTATIVPEPSTFALAALGAATLYLVRRAGAQRKAPH